MALKYLVEITKGLDSEIDPVEAELEAAEAVEDHFRGLGWDARRVAEECEREALLAVS